MSDVIVSPLPVAAPVAAPPEPGSLEALVHAELPHDDAPRPGGERWLKHPPRDLFGLALSGGGIRSATFNLGLLQGLQDMRVLGAFDYLSTVSGGGYLGAFWTAWRHRQPGREGRFPSEPGAGNAEPPEVRHLREFSNFLSPRLGVFSYDTGRIAVTALGSMLPSLLAALSVIALAILLWTSAVWVLFSPASPPWADTLLMDGGTLGALALFELAWLRRKEPSDGAAYLAAALLGVGLVAAAWYAADYWWLPENAYVAGQRLPALRPDQKWTDWRYVLAPAAAWGAALQVMLFARWFLSRTAGTPTGLRIRRAADRVRGRLLLLAGLWTGAAVLWYGGVLLESWIVPGHAQVTVPGMGGLTAVLAAAFARVQHLLSRDRGKGGGGKLLARLKPVLPQLLAYAVVLLLVMCVVGVIVAGERPGGLHFRPAYVAAAAAVVVLLVLFCMDPNEVGLHSFYRARLVRAYPGASNGGRPGSANRETEVVPLDDVPMDAVAHGAARPFHLVCCTANDLASKDAMAGLYRGAKCAVLSRVGCSVDGSWAPWGEYRTVPTLGDAITASGAAFNTLMGSLSIRLGPAVTFLMAALNLRLGLWVANPGGTRKRKPFPTPGGAFFREMFGRANTTGGYVHLSDGGHFENLAAYELIRRHCRVIVVSDCGQDTDCAFDDLGNLVRRVREDFDVEIRIDTSPLKPGADGLARQHMVAGDVHYPDGDTGLLLLFKPALVGDEPADVAQYRRRNALFPNESTSDQFYDEAQWESYRRLGRHAAHSAFRAVIADLEPPAAGVGREFWTEAFASARREWQPKPEGFDARLSRFTDRVAELDGLLREGGGALLHQVYKELDELDRRKLPLPGMPVVAEAPPEEAADAEADAPARAVRVPPRAVEGAPRLEELSTSLHLIRRALLLMAEMFESEALEASYGHPLYLGAMNWFARWAYAPLFRMWWPLLKTMYPEPFTRFLEKHFNLVSIDRGKSAGPSAPGEQAFTWIDHDADGFARTCWLVAGRAIPAGREVLSYNLRMVYEQRQQYRIQAAQLIAERAGAVVVWKVDDFFVPPGLWGIGIGGDFLATLREARHNDLPGVRHLVVKVSSDARGSAAARKAAADEMQLYRTAGFREADLADGGLVVGQTSIPLPPGWAEGDLSGTQWMVASVE
jgi:hypothetical protein